jgi:hypothetical protein
MENLSNLINIEIIKVIYFSNQIINLNKILTLINQIIMNLLIYLNLMKIIKINIILIKMIL